MIQLNNFYPGQKLDTTALNKLVGAIQELQDMHEALLNTPGDMSHIIQSHPITDHKEDKLDRWELLAKETE